MTSEHAVRFTSRGGFPLDANLLRESGALFGGSVHPFAVEGCARSSNPASSAVRCLSCGGYWWPGCNWRGNSSWLCGLCGEENPLAGRMPSPDELREFVVVYKDFDEVSRETSKGITFWFLVDVESNEQFIDASLFAIGNALSGIDPSVRIGLVVSSRESMAYFEFNETSDEFLLGTIKTRQNPDGGEIFRTNLSTVTNLEASTASNTSFAIVRALNSVKTSNGRFAEVSQKRSCVGKTLEAVVSFLASCSDSLIGARVFCFSDCLKLNAGDASSLARTAGLLAGDVGIGVDLFTVLASATDVVDDRFRRFVYSSGGKAFEHSFGEIANGILTKNLSDTCRENRVYGCMIKARTCPELVVASSGPIIPPETTQYIEESQGDSNGDGIWGIVSRLKNVAINAILKIVAPDHRHSLANNQFSVATSYKNIFLGPGQTLAQDWIWSLPSANPDASCLAFELDFASSDGLSNFAYPRSMAVQVASTFMTARGERFVRVETRSCDTDRPVRSIGEIWQTADWKQYALLLVRVLVFSQQYAPLERRDVVLDWSAKAIVKCGLERFQRKLGKLVFGLVRILENPQYSERLRLIEECDANELDKLLWPSLTTFPESKILSNLTTASILDLSAIPQQNQIIVMDAFSDILVIWSGDEMQVQTALETVSSLAASRKGRSVKVHKISRNDLTSLEAMSSPSGGMKHFNTSVDLLRCLLYDDPSVEWPQGYESFIDLISTRKVMT